MFKSVTERLRGDQKGISAVEFGLIAPVALTMLMGVMDIGHNYYVRVVMNGAMQNASRSSSLESAAAVVRQQQIDLRINDSIKAVIPTAIPVDKDGNPLQKDADVLQREMDQFQIDLTFWEAEDPSTRGERPMPPSPFKEGIFAERRFFKTFSEAAAAQAEQFTDGDDDGECNNGESYIDENGNGVWDPDGGDAGQGLAHDVVVMKVRIKYERLFPVATLLGFSKDVMVESDSVLANQPYAAQTAAGASAVRNCDA